MTILYIPEEVEKKSTLVPKLHIHAEADSIVRYGPWPPFRRDLVQSAHVSRRFRFADCHGRVSPNRRPNRIAGYPGPASPGDGDPPVAAGSASHHDPDATREDRALSLAEADRLGA